MGTKSENALLPAESAKAIYLAIESGAEANRQLIEQQNRRIDDQNRVLEKIVNGIEQVKDKLNAGAVRFEHHSGELRRLDGEVKRVSGTLSDVESDVLRIKPRVLGTTPTTPFPARRGVDGLVRTPKGVQSHRRSDESGEDAPIITVRWPKIINTLIIAFVSVFGTIAATWLVNRGAKPTTVEPAAVSGKTSAPKVEPPSALDIQDAGGPSP